MDSCSVLFNGLLWLPHIKVGLVNVCVLEVWADGDVARNDFTWSPLWFNLRCLLTSTTF